MRARISGLGITLKLERDDAFLNAQYVQVPQGKKNYSPVQSSRVVSILEVVDSASSVQSAALLFKTARIGQVVIKNCYDCLHTLSLLELG